MRYFLVFFALLLLNSSCNKDKVKAGDKVELYLLKTFQPVSGKCEVDSSQSTLQDTPLIGNDDILQYSRADYEYRLSLSALAKVKNLPGRTPFAITVDRKVIFYGFYMPPILSSTCFNSITMDLSWDQSNNMYMKLGYPGTLAGPGIDDQRNHDKLIATFLKQGKLR